jgi:ADP-dependent NAD(P)H-hydrate dehydratase
MKTVDELPRLNARAADSHKGDFGRVLVLGGSTGMAGAPCLCGDAALRSGAGLVKIATAAACQPTVASFEPSFMTVALVADTQGRIAAAARDQIEEAALEATVVGCGPGLGRSAELVELVGWLYRHVQRPIVFDADALNALAAQKSILAQPGGPRIFTPHPGEFARLLGRDTIPVEQRESLASEFARQNSVVLLLKGHRTVITDGQQTALNTTGNPGMATGGTGDVLTGIITALVGQHLSAFDAARLGAYVHGLAGDLAAERLGQVSMMSSDLLDDLPVAWKRLA